MATIKTYLDGRRLKKDGTAPIKIYVHHLSATKQVSIGVGAPPEMWDAATCRVLPEYPRAKGINAVIARAESAGQTAMLTMRASGEPIDAGAIAAKILESIGGAERRVANVRSDLLVPMFRRFIATKSKAKTIESYETTLRHVIAYGGEGVKLEDVTRSWLIGFDAHMAKTAKSPNARAVYMRSLRAVMNFALDEGVTSNYPFRKFRIKTVRTAKRSLPVESLRRLLTMEVEPWQEQYRDFFKLIFLLVGINAVDLLGADHGSIVDGRLVYNRSKTRRLYSIKVEPEAAEILEMYRGRRRLLMCMDVVGNYRNYLQRANEAMRSVGDVTRSGLGGKKSVVAEFPGISTYWMRHSWATIAAELDIPKDTIAAALGHGGNTVTDIYIDFDQRKVDEANRRVIDYVLYNKK